MPNAPETIWGKKVRMSIYLDSKTGTFYTFSIVLAASILILCLNVLSNMNGIIHIYV